MWHRLDCVVTGEHDFHPTPKNAPRGTLLATFTGRYLSAPPVNRCRECIDRERTALVNFRVVVSSRGDAPTSDSVTMLHNLIVHRAAKYVTRGGNAGHDDVLRTATGCGFRRVWIKDEAAAGLAPLKRDLMSRVWDRTQLEQHARAWLAMWTMCKEKMAEAAEGT